MQRVNSGTRMKCTADSHGGSEQLCILGRGAEAAEQKEKGDMALPEAHEGRSGTQRFLEHLRTL